MIVTTVTANDFAQWLKESDSYGNSFTIDGAYALFEYLDKLSDELDENFEFDPIAWCVEYTEYEGYQDAWNQLGNGSNFIEGEELAIDDNIKLWLTNNSVLIELDNGRIIVQDF